ncbi:hypothetical protein [Trinickia fusca]|uniref:Uncharacterized protein n=1 Tax=Trinickia fusca TaxID=2419777 RepID=A0A494XF46_9BURK|nr:hypothetical protein [Trinickia fusca]RKP49427.1 hypothetical protein D7S89_11745 [Trinickia fusca]
MKRPTSMLARAARGLAMLAAGAGLLGLTGCVTQELHPYQVSVANQEVLAQLPHAAHYRVAPGSDHADVQNKVRAYYFTTPKGETWAAYLDDGIRNELTTAGNYDANASESIQATLLAVHLADGHADLAARFVVTQGSDVRYDKVLHAKSRWRSSFVGSIAIPAAYVGAGSIFQDLLNQFFTDPDFTKLAS